MEELQRESHKFNRESDHLTRMLEKIDEASDDEARIELTLQQAKRVRRASTVLVRLLAEIRDKATAQGGHKQ